MADGEVTKMPGKARPRPTRGRRPVRNRRAPVPSRGTRLRSWFRDLSLPSATALSLVTFLAAGLVVLWLLGRPWALDPPQWGFNMGDLE